MEQNLVYINSAIILIATAFGILRWLSTKTETKIDDDFFKNLDEKYLWLEKNVYPVYILIEELSKQYKWTSVTKWMNFLTELNNKFKEAYGKPMPKYLETAANTMVSVKSAIDKVNDVKEKVVLQAEQLKAKITGDIGPHDTAIE
jgi:hypothetical protein